MIVVTIEMWPHGEEAHKYPLGQVQIVNTGRGTASHGFYQVDAYGKKGRKLVTRSAEIHNWPRLSRPVFSLLLHALKAMGY